MRDISDWLASQCVYITLRTFHTDSLPRFRQNRRMTIAGIICFHEITLTRMGWAARSAFTTLLCSDAMLKNVVLVTTKWGEVAPATGEKREEDLRNIYWKDMMQSGATIARFEPTPTSTSTVLDILLRKPPISVQTLVDQQKSMRRSLSPQKSAKKNFLGTVVWLRRVFAGSRQKSYPVP